MAECGEQLRYKYPKGFRRGDETLDNTWGEGFFLGRTGEQEKHLLEHQREFGGPPHPEEWAPIGGGARMGSPASEAFRGVEVRSQTGEPRVSSLTEEEQDIHKMQRRHEDFPIHGFTGECPGCQAALGRASGNGHSEACRLRVEHVVRMSPEGQRGSTSSGSAITHNSPGRPRRASRGARRRGCVGGGSGGGGRIPQRKGIPILRREGRSQFAAATPSSSSHPVGVSAGHTCADKTWAGRSTRGAARARDSAVLSERSDYGHLPYRGAKLCGGRWKWDEQLRGPRSNSALIEFSTGW